MKKLLICIFASFVAASSLAEGIAVVPYDVKVEHTSKNLAVGMTLNFAELPVKSTMSLTVTPVLSSSSGERLELPPVTVAGRSRYMSMQRENDEQALSPMFFRFSKDMAPFEYAVMVPFQPWMNYCELSVETNAEGCCSKDLGMMALNVSDFNLTNAMEIVAEYAYVTPQAEAVKVREIEGQAFVDFKVNQTTILPDFGRNPGELAKIRQSIDTIKGNADTKITSLSITGFASPEGSYSNNLRLAKGRTEALAAYVNSLYKFPEGLVQTSWVAEDWDGVRRFLINNPSFENCNAILDIVDSNLEPDVKDQKIKSDYPVAYRYMLENVYPPLRHTEYKVEYEVKSYTNPEEIAEVLRTHPANLSLQELYVLANSLPEGSDEYAEVFETAVRLFPNSEVAALNAAFAAMKRDDYNGAARHLEKAGNSPQAIYARGLLAAYKEDYKEAQELISKAAGLGVTQASDALVNLQNMINE